MSCKFCGITFNRGFNLRRHEKDCPLKDEDREISETESQTMDSEDDASICGSESPITTDNEAQTEEEENHPWMPMVEEAMQKHRPDFEEMKMNLIHSGQDEQSAGEKAYLNVLPMLAKELESIYMERLLWMKQLKNDPVHRKIMQTKDAFVENDDFDPEGAMEAAVNKRKFLIKRLLKNYSFIEEKNDEDE